VIAVPCGYCSILRFSAAQLRSLTEVDHHDRSVLLAEVEVRPVRWQPVGFAQYARIAGDRAEAAIALEDAWQRRGVGRALALRLVEVARAAGITAFSSDSLPRTAARLTSSERSARGPTHACSASRSS
jgi:GNAT superfamily N-acetyltransferase